ncbi:MAG: Mth938-like domain-containing protein [Rhodocyclaceae bacterium]|nr:Mth938-like domain-containing protein [Rhodocyclaceae bacterium]
MKLFLDTSGELNTVTGYGDDHVRINQNRFESNLIVLPAAIHADWAGGGFDALCEPDFERLAGLGAEIVLIGTGRRQRFPAPVLLRPLVQAQIGFEVMDLGSACRTFNILVNEGRSVAAALIFNPV